MPLDYRHMSEVAQRLRHDYLMASPFPHVVIDGLFDSNLLRDIAQECETSEKEIEKNFYGSRRKFASSDKSKWGTRTRELLTELNSPEFIAILETLTGISGLLPDPEYLGGGVHQSRTGGFLKIHADFNYHRRLKLDRRVNLLIYLNENWRDAWGGHLELWDRDMKACQQKILPTLNRTVVFSTTDYSYHGHPEPLTCPGVMSRKSLALYYYSNGRPEAEVKSGHKDTTVYLERNGETFERESQHISMITSLKDLIRNLIAK